MHGARCIGRPREGVPVGNVTHQIRAVRFQAQPPRSRAAAFQRLNRSCCAASASAELAYGPCWRSSSPATTNHQAPSSSATGAPTVNSTSWNGRAGMLLSTTMTTS